MSHDGRTELSVLDRKSDATRYRILVEIAAHQPAVSQREIADALGVTAQAVSEYVGELVDLGRVRTRGRGRYEVTKEGVDWVLSRTEELQEFTEYVSEEVIGVVDVEAAIALDSVSAGETVSLSMRDGALHAGAGVAGATAVAVSDAAAGDAVGVTDFEGLVDYEPGTVTILTLPPVGEDQRPVNRDRIETASDAHDRVAAAGTEALAAVRGTGREPDLRFGTTDGVAEAAARGLRVLLVVVESQVAAHTDRLREENLRYEVEDLVDR